VLAYLQDARFLPIGLQCCGLRGDFRLLHEVFRGVLNPEVLKNVPLFALLDEEETAVLPGKSSSKRIAPRQRIYKIATRASEPTSWFPGGARHHRGSGTIRKWSSMSRRTASFFGSPRCSNRRRIKPTDRPGRNDLPGSRPERHPHPAAAQAARGMDMLTVLGRQFSCFASNCALRAMRNPNEGDRAEATFGERIADMVAGFGGSWTFIITFLSALMVYTGVNVFSPRAERGRLSLHPAEPVPLHAGCLQAPVIMMSRIARTRKNPPARRTRLRRQPPR